jgi:predicted ArsR family transcriptional regulator
MTDAPGGRKPRVTDDELLAVLRESPDPVLSTAEIADEVPIKRRGVLNRLRGLEEQGAVRSKQLGGRNTVWWPSDDGA